MTGSQHTAAGLSPGDQLAAEPGGFRPPPDQADKRAAAEPDTIDP
jgi:hypothetical protein